MKAFSIAALFVCSASMLFAPRTASANYSIEHTTHSNPSFPAFLLKRLDRWFVTNGFDPKLHTDEAAVYQAYLESPPPLASKGPRGFLQNFNFGITFLDKSWTVGPLRLWALDRKSTLRSKFLTFATKKKISLEPEWSERLIGVGLLDQPEAVELMFELTPEIRAKLQTDFAKIDRAILEKAHFAIVRFEKGKAVFAAALELAVSETPQSRCRGSLEVTQVNQLADSAGAIYFENYVRTFQEQALARPEMLAAVKIQTGLNLGPGIIRCMKDSSVLIYP